MLLITFAIATLGSGHSKRRIQWRPPKYCIRHCSPSSSCQPASAYGQLFFFLSLFLCALPEALKLNKGPWRKITGLGNSRCAQGIYEYLFLADATDQSAVHDVLPRQRFRLGIAKRAAALALAKEAMLVIVHVSRLATITLYYCGCLTIQCRLLLNAYNFSFFLLAGYVGLRIWNTKSSGATTSCNLEKSAHGRQLVRM